MNTDYQDFKHIELTEKVIILVLNRKSGVRHLITPENSY